MSGKEVISAVKYVSGMKPEFMLSEIRDYVKGELTVAQLYDIIGPMAFDLGLRLEPVDGDYRVVRMSQARPLVLNDEKRKAQDMFLSSPHVPEKQIGRAHV